MIFDDENQVILNECNEMESERNQFTIWAKSCSPRMATEGSSETKLQGNVNTLIAEMVNTN